MNDRVLSGNFHTHIYINTQLLPSPSSFEPLRPLKTRPPTLLLPKNLRSFSHPSLSSVSSPPVTANSDGGAVAWFPFPNIIFVLFLHPSHFSVLIFRQDHGGYGGDDSRWTAASASIPEIAWVFFILPFSSRSSLLIFSFLCLRRVLRFRQSSGKFVGV